MKKILFIATLMATLASCTQTADTPEARADALLKKMTLEEKVGQMNQFEGILHQNGKPYKGLSAEEVEQWVKDGKVGSFLHVPTLEEANHLQEIALQSRLGIPLLFAFDAVHGNAFAPDNTVYPTNIGLASSFDTDMAFRIARQTAEEMRSMNLHWAFSPGVDVARDARWGRCGESFGEDPFLTSRMGEQIVRGLQEGPDGQTVLACAKHLIGGGQPTSGCNKSPTDLSERTLREIFFPPFQAAVNAGVASMMPAHNEVSGIPCHINKWLMKDVAGGEWGFDGIWVSDWMDIERVALQHRTAKDEKEAYRMAIEAGMDVHMHGPQWNDLVCELVREGSISEKRIDASVRKILAAKFRLGVFDQPLADPAGTFKVRLSPEHRQTALEAARNGIVLLKNDGILPLVKGAHKRILVTGINADDENIMGDWSASQRPENVTTILEGLKAEDPAAEFIFSDQGYSPLDMTSAAIEDASRKARGCDLVIFVAGEAMMRTRGRMTCGENSDRAEIGLSGRQCELFEKVRAAGKPMILVLVTGRPLAIEKENDASNAVLNAWEPGMCGGRAVAEIIYGDVNPSAKLPITMPRSAAQVPIFYNVRRMSYFCPFVDYPTTPLYCFGYGLSYTTYEYSDISADTRSARVTVRNSGKLAGDEIVQLYIGDERSSFTRPVKELKGFRRVHLEPGESKVVEFAITDEMLSSLDASFRPVIEPGDFTVMIGPSSSDSELLKTKITL